MCRNTKGYILRGAVILLPLALAFDTSARGAQGSVRITEINPTTVIFATSAGNVVASVGADGALLVGTPSSSSTAQISAVLRTRTQSSVRYVVISPEDLAHSEGDAGWGKSGAFVAMQENALQRLGGHIMGTSQLLPQRLRDLGVDRPHVSFSEVLSFDMNGDAIHVVHQPPGYSDADSIAHFHVAKLVYLGEAFPGDGYPMVDTNQGGKLNGLLHTLNSWTGNTIKVVPARGNVASGAEVLAFREMISTVRDRVQHLINEGQTEAQVQATHPTAEFDARWGHGRVSANAFVHEIYIDLETSKSSPKQ